MAEVESIKKESGPGIILVKLAIAVGLGLFVALLPTPENLSPEGHRLLALLVTVVILFVTEAIPIGVTALLVGSGLILFNIQTPHDAWAPYASPAVMTSIAFFSDISWLITCLSSLDILQ